MNDPRDEFPFPQPASARYGCGCVLPTSGAVLVFLTIALTWTLRTHTQGWTPLWLLVIALVLGIFALFVRIYAGRK